MPSTPMRVLAGTLATTSFVASIAWALVLLGSGSSHPASMRLEGGLRLVLHHFGEVPLLGEHDHHHAGDAPSHRHDDADHGDDHVVSVSTDPASLRGNEVKSATVLAAGSIVAVLATLPGLTARRAVALRAGCVGPPGRPTHRSTIVLRI